MRRIRRRLPLSLVAVAITVAAVVFAFTSTRHDFSPTQFETDGRLLGGQDEVITGVVRQQTDYALTGGLILRVDTDAGTTRTIVLNKHTVCHWPQNWGPLESPEPGADARDIRSPANAPGTFQGARVSATVRTVPLGVLRKQAFALDVVFTQ